VTVTVTHHAEPYERFAPGFLDGSLGKDVPAWLGGHHTGRAVLKSYTVADDGRTVELTLVVDPSTP
jgi:hypothetical protein